MTEPEVAVDCHTHLGMAGLHISGAAMDDLVRAWGTPVWNVKPDEHWRAMSGVQKAIVVAFDAPAVGIEVPNEYVAEYIARAPEKLIGFASVDPNRPRAPEMLEAAVQELGLRGLKVAPIYQHFHPHSRECLELLEVADALRIPVLWHQGTTFIRDAPLEVSQPVLLDAVARRFPELPMCIAHLGHPWCEETVVTIRKHPNLYADISALQSRPLQYYLALMTAVEYRVTHKLLFGSDFPFSSVDDTIRGLRRVNRVAEGTALPKVEDEVIEGIIGRPSLRLLGLVGDEPDKDIGPASTDEHGRQV